MFGLKVQMFRFVFFVRFNLRSLSCFVNSAKVYMEVLTHAAKSELSHYTGGTTNLTLLLLYFSYIKVLAMLYFLSKDNFNCEILSSYTEALRKVLGLYGLLYPADAAITLYLKRRYSPLDAAQHHRRMDFNLHF